MSNFSVTLRKQLYRETRATETRGPSTTLTKPVDNLPFPPFPGLIIVPGGDRESCRVVNIVITENSSEVVCHCELENLKWDQSFEYRVHEMVESGWKDLHCE